MDIKIFRIFRRLRRVASVLNRVNQVSQTIISTIDGELMVSGDAELVQSHKQLERKCNSLSKQKVELLKDIERLDGELSDCEQAQRYIFNNLKTRYPEAYKGVIAGLEEIQEKDEEE